MRTKAQLQLLLQTSEQGTRNMLEAAKAAGNARVVFVSSVAVRVREILLVDPPAGDLTSRCSRLSTAASTSKSGPTNMFCSSRSQSTRRLIRGWNGLTRKMPLPKIGATSESLSQADRFPRSSFPFSRGQSCSPFPVEKSRPPRSVVVSLSGLSTSRKPWPCSSRPSWTSSCRTHRSVLMIFNLSIPVKVL